MNFKKRHLTPGGLRMKNFICIVSAFVAFMLLMPIAIHAQYVIPVSIIGSSSGSMENSQYRIHGTLGEPIICMMQGREHAIRSGFWHAATAFKLATHANPPDTQIPAAFALNQNYPNPFNPATIIPFELPEEIMVRLEIYDVLGRRVAVLLDDVKPAGVHQASWDASGVAGGVYVYQLRAGDFVQSRKLTIVK